MTNEEKTKQVQLEQNYKEMYVAFEEAKSQLERFNKEMVEAEKKKRTKVPAEKETYFAITTDGDIHQMKNTSEYDKKIINIGNYGLSPEECEAIKERRRVNELLERYVKESGEVAWEDSKSKFKYTLIYDYLDDTLLIETVNHVRYNNAVYFNSTQAAEIAITQIGRDRIVKALFQTE